MSHSFKQVISASRRTDIPAFYMDWFMAGIRRGFFEVINPYNGKKRLVPSGQDEVHTIVFWSKNFGPFLNGAYGDTLESLGYNLFFNFTVNSEDRLLEPNIPPLRERLVQLDMLCSRFGPERVQWRFDPICFYREGRGRKKNNMHDFSKIAESAADGGVSRCVTSFMDVYPKVLRRAKAAGNVSFVTPGLGEQADIVRQMAGELRGYGISLYLCCEKELLESLPPGLGVLPGSCIPNDLFMHLDGGSLSLRHDPGQRRALGCGCRVSVDVGSYSLHPCFHNCLFCYANPACG